MKLIIESEKQVWRSNETVAVRLIALNDSYEAVTVDRRLLVGPNLTDIRSYISRKRSSRMTSSHLDSSMQRSRPTGLGARVAP